MIKVFKTAPRCHPSTLSFSFGFKASYVRFGHTTMSRRSASGRNMDRPGSPEEETMDVMWSSFGEAYATRCDEEGFGGIYGQKESVLLKEEDRTLETHSAYEKNQGGEGKEEKAGHQTKQGTT